MFYFHMRKLSVLICETASELIIKILIANRRGLNRWESLEEFDQVRIKLSESTDPAPRAPKSPYKFRPGAKIELTRFQKMCALLRIAIFKDLSFKINFENSISIEEHQSDARAL